MHLSIPFSVSKHDFWSCPRYIRSLILNSVEAINKSIYLNHVMWSFSESLPSPRIYNKIHNTVVNIVWPWKGMRLNCFPSRV